MIALIAENRHHAVEKAEEWRLEAEAHAKIHVDLTFDDES
jgi:hypothetical protein